MLGFHNQLHVNGLGFSSRFITWSRPHQIIDAYNILCFSILGIFWLWERESTVTHWVREQKAKQSKRRKWMELWSTFPWFASSLSLTQWCFSSHSLIFLYIFSDCVVSEAWTIFLRCAVVWFILVPRDGRFGVYKQRICRVSFRSGLVQPRVFYFCTLIHGLVFVSEVANRYLLRADLTDCRISCNVLLVFQFLDL